MIVAGLDQDYLGRPFEPMPQLLAIAEYITKTLAICVVCGNPANHTQRLVASSDRVLVGAQRHSTRRAAATASTRSWRGGERRSGWRRGARIVDQCAAGLTGILLLLGVGFLVANVLGSCSTSCEFRRRRAPARC